MPLLQQRGLQLVVRAADNFTLPAYPGLLLKDSYWRWPERKLAGNAIDFHVQVLGLSFHDAMRQICPFQRFSTSFLAPNTTFPSCGKSRADLSTAPVCTTIPPLTL